MLRHDWTTQVARERDKGPEMAPFSDPYYPGERSAQLQHLSYPSERQSLRSYYDSIARPNRQQDSNIEQPQMQNRKRIAVACARCRKRKIKCSGDNGDGRGCNNCQIAGAQTCNFFRVGSKDVNEFPLNNLGQNVFANASSPALLQTTCSTGIHPQQSHPQYLRGSVSYHTIPVPVTRAYDYSHWSASAISPESPVSPVSPVESYGLSQSAFTTSKACQPSYTTTEHSRPQWPTPQTLSIRSGPPVLYAEADHVPHIGSYQPPFLSAQRPHYAPIPTYNQLQGLPTPVISYARGNDRVLPPVPPPSTLRQVSSNPTSLVDISSRASALTLNSPSNYSVVAGYNGRGPTSSYTWSSSGTAEASRSQSEETVTERSYARQAAAGRGSTPMTSSISVSQSYSVAGGVREDYPTARASQSQDLCFSVDSKSDTEEDAQLQSAPGSTTTSGSSCLVVSTTSPNSSGSSDERTASDSSGLTTPTDPVHSDSSVGYPNYTFASSNSLRGTSLRNSSFLGNGQHYIPLPGPDPEHLSHRTGSLRGQMSTHFEQTQSLPSVSSPHG